MSFAMRVLIIVLLIFVVEFYFYRKLKKSLNSFFPSFKFKWYFAALFAFINIYPVILFAGWLLYYLGYSGRPETPESTLFDIFILFPFWIAALIMIQCIFYFLIIDILKIIVYPFVKKHRDILKKYEARILLVLIAVFTLYVPARIAYDYYFVSVNSVQFVKKDMPPALNNFRLVFISDIQADRYTNTKRLGNFIDKVNNLNPDLVLIAGDLITGTPQYINLAGEYTGKIKSRYGVYSCIGDHDNWAYREDTRRSLKEVSAALAKNNVQMIDNNSRVLNVNGSKIGITFATNTYVEKIDPAVLNNLANGGGKYDVKIFLTHQPRNYLISAAAEGHYDLFLAGHTHGGQVSFLFPFINITPTLFETKYVRGTFHTGNMLIHVTRGLGMSLVPIRYNSTPEITVINFRNK